MSAQGARDLEVRLLAAVLADPVCAELVERLPALDLPDWWIAAGAVFQNVWNHVEGRPPGWGITDYDVFYCDDGDLGWEAEDAVIRRVDDACADLGARLEVRNQARVHLWYAEKFGVPATPFRRATDGIDAFVATTCQVGITREAEGLRVYAPHGLEDVFALRLRPHRARPLQDVYEAKARDYQRRWPSLTVEPW